MSVQFLLFVIAILLVMVFWELSKINTRLRKALPVGKEEAKAATAQEVHSHNA